MDELISRQDAINELSYCQTYLFDSIDRDPKISLEDVKYAIEQLPSVDAVEVVRCGECKHMSPVGVCTYFADSEVRPSASDFCSYGERKTDG